MTTLVGRLDRALGPLDRQLGRITMYRLITLSLMALAAVAVVQSLTGSLPEFIFSPGWMLASLAVLLVVAVLTNVVAGRVLRISPNHESAVITALLLWFLYWPARDLEQLAWLALPAFLAVASKYLLAVRRRHVFNPAAAGVLLAVLVQEVIGDHGVYTTWWVASESMVWWVLAAALLVSRRSARTGLVIVFVVAGALFLTIGLHSFGATTTDALRTAWTSYPLVFAAGFMLTEPMTLAPRRTQRLAAALAAAVIFCWGPLTYALLGESLTVPIFGSTQELALIASNLVGFWFGQRGRVGLTLTGQQRVGDVLVSDFAPARPVRFTPGQYAELQVPHDGADARGVRRMLSIASTPASGTIRFAVRVPAAGPSTYKQALGALPVGARVAVNTVAGDFVLPRPGVPLLLVAGGIGVTPFLSQADQLRDRDVVVVYGHPAADRVAFADELAGLRVLLVMPGPAPAGLPEGWTHVEAEFLDVDTIADHVSDLGERTAMVSGSPLMVHAIGGGLRGRAARVHTDQFSGY